MGRVDIKFALKIMLRGEGIWMNPFLPEFCEMIAKKSPIFLLSFHKIRVKRDSSIYLHP
jgi:hypothetical protein